MVEAEANCVEALIIFFLIEILYIVKLAFIQKVNVFLPKQKTWKFEIVIGLKSYQILSSL